MQQQATHAVRLFYSLSHQEPTAESFNNEVDSDKKINLRKNKKRSSTRGIIEEATVYSAPFKNSWATVTSEQP